MLQRERKAGIRDDTDRTHGTNPRTDDETHISPGHDSETRARRRQRAESRLPETANDDAADRGAERVSR